MSEIEGVDTNALARVFKGLFEFFALSLDALEPDALLIVHFSPSPRQSLDVVFRLDLRGEVLGMSGLDASLSQELANAFLDDLARGAELFSYPFGHQRIEDDVGFALRVSKVSACDELCRLKFAVDASIALLESSWSLQETAGPPRCLHQPATSSKADKVTDLHFRPQRTDAAESSGRWSA